jgi:hypothetical protein
MTLPLWCLIGYASWTLLLVIAIVSARGLVVLAGKKRVNEFPGGVEHGSAHYWRLYRAHQNCVENLPIVAIVILIGTILHVHATWFERLPAIALGARVVQSLAHISSGSVAAVTIRFLGFGAQIVCFVWMIFLIVRVAG